MAKLKIFKDDDPSSNVPSKDGYRNVAKGVIADLPNFENASDKEKSNLLQGYAGKTHTIFQLTRNPDTEIAISGDNCKVNIEYDERKKASINFGKHNMVLPEIQSSDPPLDVGYLDKYVKAISELYGGGTASEVAKACEFLFGVMLLTRCR